MVLFDLISSIFPFCSFKFTFGSGNYYTVFHICFYLFIFCEGTVHICDDTVFLVIV